MDQTVTYSMSYQTIWSYYICKTKGSWTEESRETEEAVRMAHFQSIDNWARF